MDQDVLLGALYSNPQGSQFTKTQVREQYTNLYDELTGVVQAYPHIVLCGDFNARIGSLREVSVAHSEALMDCPALQAPR
eukprot:379732-Pelagomonas_calceolata.AAC.1